MDGLGRLERQEGVVATTHDRGHPVAASFGAGVVHDTDGPVRPAAGEPRPGAIFREREQSGFTDAAVQEILVRACRRIWYIHHPHRATPFFGSDHLAVVAGAAVAAMALIRSGSRRG